MVCFASVWRNVICTCRVIKNGVDLYVLGGPPSPSGGPGGGGEKGPFGVQGAHPPMAEYPCGQSRCESYVSLQSPHPSL